MRIENPELFLLKVSGKIKKISGETSDSSPNRLNIVYRIKRPIPGFICGNGSCDKKPVWLLYMRDHKKNESYTAFCDDHSPQILAN